MFLQPEIVPVVNGPAQRRVEHSSQEPALTTYINNATVEVSPFDVKLRMGLSTMQSPEVVTVKDLVHVYMSHEHFKAYVELLVDLRKRMDGMGK